MSTISGVSSINMQNIQNMDLETAMMMVQSQRTTLLDAQLQTQIQQVQSRNDSISKLNSVLSNLNAASSTFAINAKADSQLGNSAAALVAQKNVNDALASAKISSLFTTAAPGGLLSNGLRAGGGSLDSTVTKADIDRSVSQIRSQIDAAGNSQQMDMLRLQSMSNKRNEAFDVMTNFVKKMQDSRSSIIANMR